jgi:uncharacterized membrane protein YjjB (DUF3815 family)
MHLLLLQLIHQAFFGGIAAVGFGILFNCPPKMLLHCFAAGAIALLVRTLAMNAGWSLATASFLAALVLAIFDRAWQQPHTLRGSVLAVVGSIPMVPGGLAAKALMNCFALMRAEPGQSVNLVPLALENVLSAIFTLAAIGIALAIPSLLFPAPQED